MSKVLESFGDRAIEFRTESGDIEATTYGDKICIYFGNNHVNPIINNPTNTFNEDYLLVEYPLNRKILYTNKIAKLIQSLID